MKFLDLFSGIGGFRLGLQRAGHEPVGWVEIDKFARQSYQAMYDTTGEWTATDINKVTDEEWREFNGTVELIAGGFPCQSFSIAGKREGFLNKTKGTLFFEVARAVKQIKPRFVFLENVKGLLNHDKGDTFRTILNTFDELGYDVQWRVLNSKNFGVPQNRERVYIVGHIRGDSGREVFSIFGEDGEVNQANVKQIGNISDSKSFGGNPQTGRVYADDSLSPTLNTMQGGGREPKVMVKEATKKGYDTATVGDSINISQPDSKTRRGRVGHSIANTLVTGSEQATLVARNEDFLNHGEKVLSKLWEGNSEENYAEWKARIAKLVKTAEILRQVMYESALSQEQSEVWGSELVCSSRESKTGEQGNDLSRLWSEEEYRCPSYRFEYSKQFATELGRFMQKLPLEKAQKEKRMQNLWEPCERTPAMQQALHQMEKIWGSALSQSENQFRIRKLTPRETWRLQAFPDELFDKAQQAGLSDSQLYKQAGNSVTVNVIEYIGKMIERGY